MPSLTRAQIKTNVLDIMGEDGGTGSLLDRPAMQDTWVNTAADEIARATFCFYTSLTQDTVAGQAAYSAPQIFDIKSAYVTDTDFAKRLLQPVTARDLDQLLPRWRDAPPGLPRYLLVNGANSAALFPPPSAGSLVNFYTDLTAVDAQDLSSVSRPFAPTDAGCSLRVVGGTGFVPGVYPVTAVNEGVAALGAAAASSGASGGQAALSLGGLTILGYGVPGDSWPLPTSACPLPDRAHLAVVWRTAIYRSIQFPTKDNAARLPMLRDEYSRALGLLEREMHRLSDAQAHGDSHAFPFAGAF